MCNLSVKEQKSALRRHTRQAAAAYYSQNRERCSRALLRQLQALPKFLGILPVFCFVGTALEPDTLPLLRLLLESARPVAVPLCIAPGRMEARLISSLDDLRPGRWGILEPHTGCPVLEKTQIGFALVPCLCCDLRGRRLGHGGGYYDRFLAGSTFPWAVFCPEELVADRVPTEPFDLTAPILITDQRTLRFSPESAGATAQAE